MNWELAGDIFLCLLIVSVPVIFAIANVNYVPDVKKKRE